MEYFSIEKLCNDPSVVEVLQKSLRGATSCAINTHVKSYEDALFVANGIKEVFEKLQANKET